MKWKLLLGCFVLAALVLIGYAVAPADAACYQNFVRVECPSGKISSTLIPTLTNYQTTAAMTDYQTTAAMTGYASATHTHTVTDVSGVISTATLTNYVPWSELTSTATSTSTTGDVSTSHHGLSPACPGGGTMFWRDDCTWATPAGGGSGGLTTGYDADFSTFTNQTISADGNFTLSDGTVWVAKNKALTQTFAVQNGSGIYLRCAAGSSCGDSYSGTWTSPRVEVSLKALSSAINAATSVEIWVLVYYSQPHTPNVNYEGARLMVEMWPAVDSGGAFRRYGIIRGWNSGQGNLYSAAEFHNAGSSNQLTGLSTSPDVIGFRILANSRVELYYGSSTGGTFPALSALTLYSVLHMSPSALLTMTKDANKEAPSDWGFLATVVTAGNTSGNADLLIKRLRVLYR